MTESKICTCPSGDGSLRWPCPAHPAVEQAGGDERAAFEVWASALGWKLSPDQNNCGIVVAERYGHPGVQRCWEAWQARAALAQPSPAQAEKAEVERTEGSADLLAIVREAVAGAYNEWKMISEAVTEIMEAHERIVGELRADRDSWAEQAEQRLADWDEMRKERDAALARVAELTATRNRYGVDAHYFNKNLQRILRDFESFTSDELARSLIILAKVADEKVVAQAQHSAGYAEARQCVNCRHIGINDAADYAACHDCRWTGPEPDEDKCPGCAGENCMAAACPECGGRYELVAEANIATPVAQAQHSVPEGYALIPVRETEAMHDAVMALLYKGVARTDTQKLLDAYIAAAPGKEGV